MFKRWGLVGFLYILFGMPIMIGVIQSENQTPWLITFGVYFIIVATLGNWYVFYGGRDERFEEAGVRRLNAARTIFIYLIALMFLALGIQIAVRALVQGFGIGAEYFPNAVTLAGQISAPRLIGWLLGGALFITTSVFLAFKSSHAILIMGIGAIGYLTGASHDYFLLKADSYLPPAANELFIMGPALLIFFLVVVMFRLGGDLK